MRVLVVDDEPAVRAAVTRALTLDGYEVVAAEDGPAALGAIQREQPELVVLDILMPELDGVAVCRRLRSDGDRTPILMLTARDAVADRVAGLDAGADDYLVKPFALEELLARVRALLRRTADGEPRRRPPLRRPSLDPATREVRRGDREVELTRTEFSSSSCSCATRARCCRGRRSSTASGATTSGRRSNSLEVYVGYLRRKLEAGGSRG